MLDEVLAKSEPCRIETRFPKEGKRIHKKKVEKFFPVGTPLFAVGMKEDDLGGRRKSEEILAQQAQHEILSDMLFGKSGALYNDLYDQGLIGDRFSLEYNLSKSYGYLMIYGESRRPETVYRHIRETVKNAKNLVMREDFERSRKAVYARAVQDWNSTTQIAENFMDFAFSGTDMLLYPETVAAVTYEDILKRIEASYKPSRLVLSVVKKAKEEVE